MSMYAHRLLPGLLPVALALACAGAPRATLPQSDSFADARCEWPRGEFAGFDMACDGGAYRWTLTQTGPLHVARTLGLRAGAVTLEVDATALDGKGTEPGNAAFGIG